MLMPPLGLIYGVEQCKAHIMPSIGPIFRSRGRPNGSGLRSRPISPDTKAVGDVSEFEPLT